MSCKATPQPYAPEGVWRHGCTNCRYKKVSVAADFLIAVIDITLLQITVAPFAASTPLRCRPAFNRQSNDFNILKFRI
jgi:hypothetical protein